MWQYRNSVCALLVVGSVSALGCGSEDRGTVDVAVIGTWSGEEDWRPFFAGAEQAAATINAAGGIDGRRLRIRAFDDRYGTGHLDTAIATARRIVAEPEVVAVIGHTSSEATTAAGSIYRGEIPLLVPGCLPEPLGRRDPQWAFGIGSPEAWGRAVARFARERGVRETAILFDNTPCGRLLMEAARAELPGRVVLEDPVLLLNEEVVEIYRSHLRERGIGLLVAATSRRNAQRLLHGLGPDRSFPVLGHPVWGGLGCDVVAGAVQREAFVALPSSEDGSGVEPFPPLRHPAAEAIRIIAAAIGAAGPDRLGIREYLAARPPSRSPDAAGGARPRGLTVVPLADILECADSSAP